MTVDELLRRVRAVANMELPGADDASYFTHTKEWCEGYQACARDFLRALERDPLRRPEGDG